ncbi:NADP-dependent oxidoreductase [Streptomyces sp. PSRA5]|uniref:NADP-dependent oxidoreductase n=1 Tax=Streptomyces panacea TaxID=3035064 RepID=UPI00339CD237
MKAIVYKDYGGSEVLRLAEVEEPHAGPGQVRLKVMAVGVNGLDYKIRHGWLQQVFPVTFPVIPGMEAAGVVDEVGEGVTGISVGDEVMGMTTTGCYAQYALAADVALKPAALDWESAAALPAAVQTSHGVLDVLKVTRGETLLIHGAAGVVGSAGVQLAVGLGVTVIGTASEANHDYLRSLGAVPVVYGDGLVERVHAVAPQGIDAVYDAAGYDALAASVLLRGGTTDRVVTIADQRAAELGVEFFMGTPGPFAAELADYARLAADGQLRIRIDRSFPLADAAEAEELSEAGHPRGKLILLP